MFLDLHQPRPEPVCCASCSRPITTNDFVVIATDIPEIVDMNGTYHASCARPILSIIRALTVLRNPLS